MDRGVVERISDEFDRLCFSLRKWRGFRDRLCTRRAPSPNPSPHMRWRVIQLFVWGLLFPIALFSFGCAANQGNRSLPPEVESAIGTINDEIAAERYDKIHNDASELWRQDATLEESTAKFKALRTKLGPVENRVLQSATEQQNSGGPLKGRAFIVAYRTKFQNGEGMETFTVVERNGHWLLARYFVNSTALK